MVELDYFAEDRACALTHARVIASREHLDLLKVKAIDEVDDADTLRELGQGDV